MGTLRFTSSSEHWPDCSRRSAENEFRVSLHAAYSADWIAIKKKKYLQVCKVSEQKIYNCIRTGVRKKESYLEKLQIPSVWREAWLCANARTQACCSKLFPCWKWLKLFCQSPTKSRVQQEPIFLLKHLLSSLHSVKEQLEKSGIKPAEEFSYRIHFAATSLHSCTCVRQPGTYSCGPTQPAARLALSPTTHMRSLSPLPPPRTAVLSMRKKKKNNKNSNN